MPAKPDLKRQTSGGDANRKQALREKTCKTLLAKYPQIQKWWNSHFDSRKSAPGPVEKALMKDFKVTQHVASVIVGVLMQQPGRSYVSFRDFVLLAGRFGSWTNLVPRIKQVVFDKHGHWYKWFHGTHPVVTASPVDGQYLVRYAGSDLSMLVVQCAFKRDGKTIERKYLVRIETSGVSVKVSPKKMDAFNSIRALFKRYPKRFRHALACTVWSTFPPTSNASPSHGKSIYSQASCDGNTRHARGHTGSGSHKSTLSRYASAVDETAAARSPASHRRQTSINRYSSAVSDEVATPSPKSASSKPQLNRYASAV